MQKNSHIDDASEISTYDGSRKRRKADEVSVGGRLSDYLVPCHPYGYKHPKHKEFEVNIVDLMAHAFTSLSLVDHDCFRKLKQYLDPRLCPVGQSKLSRSLITTKNKLVEKSVIERLAEVKAVVISYDLWMSRKTEEILSLTVHYCKGQDRKTLTLGCPPPLLLMVFPCLCLLWRWWRISDQRQILWGLRVMVVAIFGFVGRHWSQITLMTMFFNHPSPY